MAGELQLPYDSGLTLYAHVLNASGQRWNGSAFETYNEANWTTYDVALTEQGASGLYVGDFAAAGIYEALVYQQAGATPAVTDAPPVGQGTIGTESALARLLGLSHENWGLRSPVFSGVNMTAATLCVYDSAANALLNDGVSGLVASYTFAASYTGANLTAASQRRVT
jgi:hypothetical protein